jgi:1,4-dihydroxy-6-naphthoate synthase
VDAGVVIHEGQLTYEADGLHLVEDLGAWWGRETGEPLPLGVNAVRRDLEELHGKGTLQEIAGLLERSVRFALEHRERSVSYAMGFGRGIPRETADRFIELYVNQLTVDAGDRGLNAVNRLLGTAADAGLVPAVERIDFIRGTTTT